MASKHRHQVTLALSCRSDLDADTVVAAVRRAVDNQRLYVSRKVSLVYWLDRLVNSYPERHDDISIESIDVAGGGE